MSNSRDTSSESRSSTRRAGSLKEKIRQDGREKIENGKRAAADQMEEIADAIDLAGSQLDRSQPTLAGYAGTIADGVGNLATRLREGSVEELSREARQFATRNPGMFLLGSAAFGIVIARFLKASGGQLADSPEETAERDSGDAYGSSASDEGMESSDDRGEKPATESSAQQTSYTARSEGA